MFAAYETKYKATADLCKRVSIYLRHSGVHTVAQLADLFYIAPQELLSIRGIGPESMRLIEEVLKDYEEMKQKRM